MSNWGDEEDWGVDDDEDSIMVGELGWRNQSNGNSKGLVHSRSFDPRFVKNRFSSRRCSKRACNNGAVIEMQRLKIESHFCSPLK